MKKEEMITLIEATLSKIRPFIRRDGGDVKLVGFEDGIVYVEMLGACVGCVFVNNTISDGIEVILMEEVPGVIGVKEVNEMPESARLVPLSKKRQN